MTLLLYAGKVVACSALLFGYYFFFLRNKQFHQYNRYYLLGCTVLSLLLPLVSVSFQTPGRYDNTLIKTLQVISVRDWEEVVLPAQQPSFNPVFTFQNCLLIIYLAGVVVSGYSFLKSLLYIRAISKKYRKETSNGISFFNTGGEPGTPFSFFRAVYWNADIQPASREGQDMLRHELYHIRAGHSYDIIFMQCVNMLCWFNLFFRFYLTELKAIHEFTADNHASSAVNKWDYAELLVTRIINTKKSLLFNQFFNTQIKRRIHMLIQQNKPGFSYARKMMALPVLAILFCAFSLKKSSYSTDSGVPATGAAGPLTVVIDAGHGGSDPGAHGSNGVFEKDLALSIAQKIKSLGPLYGVDVIMTRNNDEFPGNASNLREGNRNRLTVVQQSNADLFISIHLGAMNIKSRGGFDVYISSLNKEFQKSRMLGSAILGEVKSIYKVTEVLKEIDRQILVLGSSAVPAVMVDCGYITNEADVAFIKKEKNQESVAHNILKGIVKYQKTVGP